MRITSFNLVTLAVQPVVGHVVQNLHAYNETKIFGLGLQIENRPIEDFDLATVKELTVILAHKVLALAGLVR